MKNEFVTQKERLSYELTENWKEKIQCETDETENRINLRLLLPWDRENFSSVLNSMLILSTLDKKCLQLSSFLKNSILEPLVRQEGTLKIESIGHVTQISIFKHKSSTVNRKWEEIFDDIRELFEILLKIFDFKLNRLVKEQKFRNLLQIIGFYSAEPILREIVVRILKPAVPGDRNVAETESFQKLLVSCEMLEKRLKNARFLSADFKDFETFAADIDSLFLNKRCQTILTEARRLVTSNLHNTIEVGVDEGAGDLMNTIEELATVDEKKMAELEARTPLRFDNEKKLPAMFRFPKCRVR